MNCILNQISHLSILQFRHPSPALNYLFFCMGFVGQMAKMVNCGHLDMGSAKRAIEMYYIQLKSALLTRLLFTKVLLDVNIYISREICYKHSFAT